MRAQNAITTNLGVTPVSFAYPSGSTPANLVASVKASGIKVAYTTVRGVRQTLGTAYLLPRIRINRTTGAANLVVFLDRYR